MSDKIQEIRKALEAATPGPWKLVDKHIFTEKTDSEGYHAVITKMSIHHEHNAHLIANAPEWLSYLLNELVAAKQENERLRWLNENLSEQVLQAKEIKEKFHAAIDSLEKVGNVDLSPSEWVYIAHNALSLIREEAGNGPKAIDPTASPSRQAAAEGGIP